MHGRRGPRRPPAAPTAHLACGTSRSGPPVPAQRRTRVPRPPATMRDSTHSVAPAIPYAESDIFGVHARCRIIGDELHAGVEIVGRLLATTRGPRQCTDTFT